MKRLDGLGFDHFDLAGLEIDRAVDIEALAAGCLFDRQVLVLVHSFSDRFKTRNSNLIAASSVGKCPLARTALRSFEFSASIA